MSKAGILGAVIFMGWSMWPSAARSQDQSLIQTMIKQIGILATDYEEAKQGYDIIHSGLNTISEIKKGDFDLHSLFFTSLMNVNPAIKGYAKIADIIAMQSQILSGAKSNLSAFTSSSLFTKSELTYLSQVYSNLTDLTGADIDELTGIITDGDWQMTDSERLARIDDLFKRVTQKYEFLRAFSSQMQVRALQRQTNNNSIQNLSKLFSP